MNSAVQLHENASAIMDMDTEGLGEAIYDRVTAEDSGNFQNMGRDMHTVIRQAKAGSIDPLEAVEKTLIAISGFGFASTAGLPHGST